MKKKGIIFDLDGTLWDVLEQVVPIWNSVLDKHLECGRTITIDNLGSYMGKTMDEIAALMLPNLDEKKRAEILEECCEEEHIYLKEHGGKLYPNLESTLSKLLDEYDLFIVSNSQDGYVQDFIFAHKLEKYFKDFEMAGRTGKDKGYNIRLIMERNKIEEAVYVGDTMGDYLATKKAGIPFIYAKYGFGEVEDACNTINAFDELPKILQTVFNMVNEERTV